MNRKQPDYTSKEPNIARFRELALGALPQSVIVTKASDRANPIIYANPAFCDLTGYSCDEVMGRDCDMLGGVGTSKESRSEMREAVEARRRYHGVILNYRKDGTPFWNDLTIVPIEDDSDLYFVGIQSDVSQQIALEAGLRESQKMDALGKLSGGIAHDFNNILALIMGNAEIIAGEHVDPSIAEAAREIIEAAESGSELVRRMLQFAGGQSETEQVNVNHLIRNVVMMLRRTMGDTVRIETDLSEAVGEVSADKVMFRTALMNLALNARDALPDGGTVRIATRRRVQPVATIEDGVVITVADEGIGMDEATVKRAFEPFFTTKHAGRGTGLGLSMVYRFTVEAGGTVSIASVKGEGTTISLILPVSASATTTLDGHVPSAPRTRVMLVEDDPKMRKMLALHLSRAGYVLDEASGAAEAIDLVCGGGDHHLIISDIRLGAGMNGIDLVTAIRARRPGLPILLITGHSDELDQAPNQIDGVPILRKPFRVQDLLRTVEQMLTKSTMGENLPN